MHRENVTPIGGARTHGRRQHARSRIAGRLLAVFEQLCTIARESREAGEDHNDPLLRRLGGRNHIGEGSPLFDAMMAVCHEGVELLRATEPDTDPAREPPL